MAFTSAVLFSTVIGNKKLVVGTGTSGGGSTGGDCVTGLKKVDGFWTQGLGAAVSANQNAVNETFPLAGGDVTVVTDADKAFLWFALGN